MMIHITMKKVKRIEVVKLVLKVARSMGRSWRDIVGVMNNRLRNLISDGAQWRWARGAYEAWEKLVILRLGPTTLTEI